MSGHYSGQSPSSLVNVRLHDRQFDSLLDGIFGGGATTTPGGTWSGSDPSTTTGSGSDTTTTTGSGNGGTITTTPGGSSGNGSGSGTTTAGTGSVSGSGSSSSGTLIPATQTSTSTGTRSASSTSTPAPVSTVVTQSRQGPSVTEVTSTIAGTQTNSVVIVQTTASASTPATGTSSGSGGRSSSSSSKGGVIGGIVGGVLGGLALLTLVAIIVLWSRRKSRTGRGWFLCFGRRPRADEEIDWNTFDPSGQYDSAAAAAGVGGAETAGGAFGRRRGKAGADATLPEGFDDDPELLGDSPSCAGHSGEMAQYAGAGAAIGTGAGAAAGYFDQTRSDDGSQSHKNNHTPWSAYPPHPSYYHSSRPAPAQSPSNAAQQPSYEHLDPPEIRKQRMREQAALAAAGLAMGVGGIAVGSSRRPSTSAPSETGHVQHPNSLTPGRGGGASPPPPSGNKYWDPHIGLPQDGPPSGPQGGTRRGSQSYHAPPPAYGDAPEGGVMAGSDASVGADDDDGGDAAIAQQYLAGGGGGNSGGLSGQRLTLSNPDAADEDEERDALTTHPVKDVKPSKGTWRHQGV